MSLLAYVFSLIFPIVLWSCLSAGILPAFDYRYLAFNGMSYSASKHRRGGYSLWTSAVALTFNGSASESLKLVFLFLGSRLLSCSLCGLTILLRICLDLNLASINWRKNFSK